MTICPGNTKELLRGWAQSGLSKAWGPEQAALYKEACELEAKKELFGGEKTAITKLPDEHSQELVAKDGEEPVPEEPEAAAEAPPSPDAYGCPTCRYSGSGCWKCNPIKTIRYWEKKFSSGRTQSFTFSSGETAAPRFPPLFVSRRPGGPRDSSIRSHPDTANQKTTRAVYA